MTSGKVERESSLIYLAQIPKLKKGIPYLPYILTFTAYYETSNDVALYASKAQP